MWQEYVCMAAQPPSACSLDQSLPVECAASFFVNPLTAIALFDVAKRKGSPAFIHTVGNSQLGQMMVKLAKSEGVTIVNMVRKEEGKALLESLGAEHVVVTSREGWQDELKNLEAFYLATWLTEGGMLKTIMRIRSCFKLSMPALGGGAWAESLFEDCRMEDMWPKMCKSQSKTKKLRIRMDL